MKTLICVSSAAKPNALALGDKPRYSRPVTRSGRSPLKLPRLSILLGTVAFLFAFALLGNFSQSLAGTENQDETGQSPTSYTYSVVTYHAPRLDGFDLDTRLTKYRQSSTLPTADRYCRDRGYSAAFDFTVRPSIATRTLDDKVVHIDRSGRQQAFAMIQCKKIQIDAVHSG